MSNNNLFFNKEPVAFTERTGDAFPWRRRRLGRDLAGMGECASVDDERPIADGGAGSFLAFYRTLILGSAERAALAELQLQRAQGHRLRARRAERNVHALRGLADHDAPAAARSGFERRVLPGAIRVCWAVVLVFLVVSVARLGTHSWWTGGGDLALIALTFAWFALDSRLIRSTEPSGVSHPSGSSAPADAAH